MYELKVTVSKVLGTCTAEPPTQRGDHFTVCDGSIQIPAGGYVCLWALQSLLPVITPKEREIAERKDEDWMWRVHHVQCPDPEGRVVYQIERLRKLGGDVEKSPDLHDTVDAQGSTTAPNAEDRGGPIRDLRVVVDEMRGRCTSGMRPGDHFSLRSGRLYIPAGRRFCLYALQAVLPFLAAKQRRLEEGDWLKGADRVICPDPAGNVILRIERCP